MARGGKRPNAGRKAGKPNKITSDVKTMASVHGKAAIEKLVRLMNHAESEQAQIAACKEILDRAYGKAAQAVTGEGGTGPVKLQISWLPSIAS